MPRWSNWAGNVSATPNRISSPTTIGELSGLLSNGGPVRFLGSGHSSSPLVPSDGTIIDMTGLNEVVGLDRRRGTVRVQGGIAMRKLGAWLAQSGYLLRSVGSSWYPSVGGALATGTHGSGTAWGSVSGSACLKAMRLMTPSGEILDLDDDREKDRDVLAAARTHLGVLGAVVEAELAVEAGHAYHVVVQQRTLDEALDPAFREAHEHAEAFWIPYTDVAITITRDRVEEPVRRRWVRPNVLGRILGEDLPIRPISGIAHRFPSLAPRMMEMIARHAGVRTARTLPWDHASIGPRWLRGSSVEYGVPAGVTVEAVAALRTVVDDIRDDAPAHLPVNIRWVKGDEGSYLSPTEGRDTCYIEVPCRPRFTGATRLLSAVEDALWPLGARPHWGKVHFRNPGGRYSNLPKFERVRQQLDPHGRLMNGYVKRLLSGEPLRAPR